MLSAFFFGVACTLALSLAGAGLWLVVERARYYRAARKRAELELVYLEKAIRFAHRERYSTSMEAAN